MGPFQGAFRGKGGQSQDADQAAMNGRGGAPLARAQMSPNAVYARAQMSPTVAQTVGLAAANRKSLIRVNRGLLTHEFCVRGSSRRRSDVEPRGDRARPAR